jgi:hypothetical protein
MFRHEYTLDEVGGKKRGRGGERVRKRKVSLLIQQKKIM